MGRGRSTDRRRGGLAAEVGGVALRPPGHLPFSPRAKKVLELSLKEALALRHRYIGTEHLLFAILRERAGLAAQTLVDRDLRLDQVRQQVLQALGRVA